MDAMPDADEVDATHSEARYKRQKIQDERGRVPVTILPALLPTPAWAQTIPPTPQSADSMRSRQQNRPVLFNRRTNTSNLKNYPSHHHPTGVAIWILQKVEQVNRDRRENAPTTASVFGPQSANTIGMAAPHPLSLPVPARTTPYDLDQVREDVEEARLQAQRDRKNKQRTENWVKNKENDIVARAKFDAKKRFTASKSDADKQTWIEERVKEDYDRLMSKLASQFHVDVKELGPFQLGFAPHYFNKDSWKELKVDPQALRAGELLADVLPGAIESEVTPRSEKAVEDLMKALEGSRPSQMSFYEGIRLLSENFQVLEGVDRVLATLFTPKLGVSSLVKTRHDSHENHQSDPRPRTSQTESTPPRALTQYAPAMAQWAPRPNQNDTTQTPNSATQPGHGYQMQPFGIPMPYYGPPMFTGQHPPVPFQYGPQFPFPPPFYPPTYATQQPPNSAPTLVVDTLKKETPKEEADAAAPARRRREDRVQTDGTRSERGADDTLSVNEAATPQVVDEVKVFSDALDDKRSESDDSIIVIARPQAEQEDLMDEADYNTDSNNSRKRSPVHETAATASIISASGNHTERSSQAPSRDFHMVETRSQRNGSLGQLNVSASSSSQEDFHNSDIDTSVMRSRVLTEPRPIRKSSLTSPKYSLDPLHGNSPMATRRSSRVPAISTALASEEHNISDQASSNGSDDYEDRSVSDHDQIEQSTDEETPVVRVSRRERKLTEKGRELPKFLPKKKRLSSPPVQSPPSKIVRLTLPSSKGIPLLKADQSKSVSTSPENSLASRYLQGMRNTDNTSIIASTHVSDPDNEVGTSEEKHEEDLRDVLLASRNTRSMRPRLVKSQNRGYTVEKPLIGKGSLRSRKHLASPMAAAVSVDSEPLNAEVPPPASRSIPDPCITTVLVDPQETSAGTGMQRDANSVSEINAKLSSNQPDVQTDNEPGLIAAPIQGRDTVRVDSSLVVWAEIAADWSDSPENSDEESSESEHEFQQKMIRALQNHAAREAISSAPPTNLSKDVPQVSSAIPSKESISAPVPVANQYQTIQRDFTAAYPPMYSQPQWPPHYYGNQYWQHTPAQYPFVSPYGPNSSMNQGSYGFSQMPSPQPWPPQAYPRQNGYDGRHVPVGLTNHTYSPSKKENNGTVINQVQGTSPTGQQPQNIPVQQTVPNQPPLGQGISYSGPQYVAPTSNANGHANPAFPAYWAQPDCSSPPYNSNGPALAPGPRSLASRSDKVTPPAFSAASVHRRDPEGLITLAPAPAQSQYNSSGRSYKELRIKRIDTPGSVSSSRSSVTTSKLRNHSVNSLQPNGHLEGGANAHNASIETHDDLPSDSAATSSSQIADNGANDASGHVRIRDNGLNEHDEVMVGE